MALLWAARPPSPMHPLAGAAAGLFVGTIGTIYVGWTTVPVGAAVGYAPGRRRTGDRSLAARVRERL